MKLALELFECKPKIKVNQTNFKSRDLFKMLFSKMDHLKG